MVSVGRATYQHRTGCHSILKAPQYTANQLPAKDMMVVPRTTWYEAVDDDDVVIVTSSGDVVLPDEQQDIADDALILPRQTWC